MHVPFCQSKCIYCDFYVELDKYGGQEAHVAYTRALEREIRARFEHAGDYLSPVESVYVGGGTPSLLSAREYQHLFDVIGQYVPFHSDAELTLEANPMAMADGPEAYLEVAGFNRLSIGVQSLDEEELKRLSRLHTARQAMDFVYRMGEAGFRNLSIDLMYGIPGQSAKSWANTLERVSALNIQHVSMYGLKVEDGTPLSTILDHPRGRDRYQLPEDELAVQMYFDGIDALESSGFSLYEFSNLAKPGFSSNHNLNYWSNGFYWAFGASAHGYVPVPGGVPVRYENVRNLPAYLENPLSGQTQPCPSEEQLENAIIFGLRKSDGINITSLERQFQFNFFERYGWIFEKYSDTDWLVCSNGNVRLSRKAIPLSNNILADFLG
ncbi:MAG: radical SAM family heme chaperone HemW [Vampirovibrionales bacterium]|nr:radical SAM family heme chaperone HemW [Vampirovibrionales bacterium]